MNLETFGHVTEEHFELGDALFYKKQKVTVARRVQDNDMC